MAAPPMNQLRNACAQTLRLANPIAPRKPKGRQQARVESAAITAAMGVARSAAFIHPPLPTTATGVVIKPNFCSSEIAEGSFVYIVVVVLNLFLRKYSFTLAQNIQPG